ncbi:MAG TPA: histidine kinase [Chitinophagaceae bacterium]|jgi:sensor histidine kinase YesM
MNIPGFTHLFLFLLFSSLMLVAGLYLLAKFSRLFKSRIRNELLRKNIVVWMIAVCLLISVAPTTPDFYGALYKHRVLQFYELQCFGVTAEVLFVFNITYAVAGYFQRKNYNFRKRMGIILATLLVSVMIMSFPLNYLGNAVLGDGPSFKSIEYTLLFNFYTGMMTGMVFIAMSYVDVDRQRKMSEKDLEVSRLQELKTKAELDALHSKINPHFLYNALNSIADLSVTDGKKARKMTIALADLFRYSINYSQHNYSSVREELDMAEVYLAIEKIRFEDQLTYSIHVQDGVEHYLVPRFVLQPVVENAVKHGLKATGKMTEIAIHIRFMDTSDGLDIRVADNGPEFPADIIPGYGVKSIYDKLDLLFPAGYEIHFRNHPVKEVAIVLHKLMKNEPV